MTEGIGCMSLAGRCSNAEFGALLVQAQQGGGEASPRLLKALVPLLVAFFEGQVQAGRMRGEDLGEVLRATLKAVDSQRASYDPAGPFRAWLLDIARQELGEYQRRSAAQVVLSQADARQRLSRTSRKCARVL
ncbi:hypothetical protein P3W55_10155 [Pseudomonas citronellolis]|uniref:Uncharacterized protein n=2 Tax=Pseudomonas TaxID=286 RepID=A0AAW6P6N1_9PSED|nr:MULTISPECIES: hypothetical protein [Pseudomonas]KSW22001.1 hypothetical protein AOX63_00745 [Pseudomonas sp. ADP]MDF3842073.1 hypothetical protein [Pseudomonas citronellolis]OBP10553.1 hypothetical protein BAE52_15330 [Pseudomonas sp. EGD-AKN5]QOF84781.1 hypothetical protein IG194_30425 [Pseudomonas sp. ADPe]